MEERRHTRDDSEHRDAIHPVPILRSENTITVSAGQRNEMRLTGSAGAVAAGRLSLGSVNMNIRG
jgi:hypothetical protein